MTDPTRPTPLLTSPWPLPSRGTSSGGATSDQGSRDTSIGAVPDSNQDYRPRYLHICPRCGGKFLSRSHATLYCPTCRPLRTEEIAKHERSTRGTWRKEHRRARKRLEKAIEKRRALVSGDLARAKHRVQGTLDEELHRLEKTIRHWRSRAMNLVNAIRRWKPLCAMCGQPKKPEARFCEGCSRLRHLERDRRWHNQWDNSSTKLGSAPVRATQVLGHPLHHWTPTVDPEDIDAERPAPSRSEARDR